MHPPARRARYSAAVSRSSSTVTTPLAAALLLDRLAVLDVSIEDPPLEDVIERVFSDG